MNVVTRRIIIIVMLATAAGIAAYVYSNAPFGEDATSDTKPAFVEGLIPRSGSAVLKQDQVGIDLARGYDAYLDINGTTISNEAAAPGDDGLNKTLSVGLVTYQPGEGKRIKSLNPEKNCVTAFVWKQQEGQQSAVPVNWCFTAS